MKDLIKISEVLVKSKKNVKKTVPLFDHIHGKKSMQLLKGVISDKFVSDGEASRAIYNGPDKPDKKFLMLKSRLRKKMIEETFFLNPYNKNRSPYESCLNESYRNLSIAKTFLSVGMRKEAMDVIKPLFVQSRFYKITDIILSAARMLRYNASLQGTSEELTRYDIIIEETKKELFAEIESEMIVEDLNIETRFSYSNRNDLVKRTKEKYDKLVGLSGIYQSHVLRLNTFRLGIRYFEHIRDYKGIIRVCEDCEAYLSANPQFYQNSRYAEMALFKMDACLHLQNYEKGKEYAEVCIGYFNKGFHNWFVFMEYFFLLSLQTRNYEQALKIFREVTKHPKFKNVAPERREKWKLFEAYMNFGVPAELADSEYKLYKFINEVPIFNRDKKGYNLSIMIAQFLLLLKMKDHDRLLLKQDSFTLYFKRYVKKKYNYRSYYFSKMLLIILRSNFNAGKTQSLSNKYLQKLKARNERYHGNLESLEVIPYEQLWSEVLKKLELNAEGSRYFIQPVARRGRKKVKISKNMAAAIRFKAQSKQENMRQHSLS